MWKRRQMHPHGALYWRASLRHAWESGAPRSDGQRGWAHPLTICGIRNYYLYIYHHLSTTIHDFYRLLASSWWTACHSDAFGAKWLASKLPGEKPGRLFQDALASYWRVQGQVTQGGQDAWHRHRQSISLRNLGFTVHLFTCFYYVLRKLSHLVFVFLHFARPTTLTSHVRVKFQDLIWVPASGSAPLLWIRCCLVRYLTRDRHTGGWKLNWLQAQHLF